MLLGNKYYFLLVCLIACSCLAPSGKNLDGRDSYLYDKVGYDPGTRPQNGGSSSPPVQVVPDYYYRTPPVVARPSAPMPPRNSFSQQYPPASRFYSNPYSFNPPVAFPFYDSDQYYVPPRNVSNGEDAANVGPQKQNNEGNGPR